LLIGVNDLPRAIKPTVFVGLSKKGLRVFPGLFEVRLASPFLKHSSANIRAMPSL
jgi:hypothetical protein